MNVSVWSVCSHKFLLICAIYTDTHTHAKPAYKCRRFHRVYEFIQRYSIDIYINKYVYCRFHKKTALHSPARAHRFVVDIQFPHINSTLIHHLTAPDRDSHSHIYRAYTECFVCCSHTNTVVGDHAPAYTMGII